MASSLLRSVRSVRSALLLGFHRIAPSASCISPFVSSISPSPSPSCIPASPASIWLSFTRYYVHPRYTDHVGTFKCYLCGLMYADHDQIRSHLDNYECIAYCTTLPEQHMQPDIVFNEFYATAIKYHPTYQRFLPLIAVKFIAQDLNILVNVLGQFSDSRVVIYVNTPMRAIALDVMLKKCFKYSTNIHYQMDRSERNQIAQTVKHGFYKILVTTDLMETLDLGEVDAIFHFDFVYSDFYTYENRILFQVGAPTKIIFIMGGIWRGLEEVLLPLEQYPIDLGDDQMLCKETIRVPYERVKFFVGENGWHIKKLKHEYSVQVYIRRDNENLSVPIELRGSTIQVIKALWQISSFLANVEQSLCRPPVAATVRWKPPSKHLFKLNTDGASKGNPGSAGSGAIIRGRTGNFVAARARNIFYGSALLAEAWGLYDGLDLARERNILSIEAETDSKSLVTQLHCPGEEVAEICFLIVKIRNIIANDLDSVMVRHVLREANNAANLLANHGVTLAKEDVVTWDSPPDFLVSCIKIESI